MGKKKNIPEEKKTSALPWIIAVVVAVVAVLAISGNLPFTGAEKETGKSFNLSGKETRPVLDPAQFTGQTRMAYAAAKEYADMLNEVFCYCYCDEEPFNHSTLLSCFATEHGAG
ncbi:MAG TPA: hypothetical protein ENH45_05365 [Nitrospirae bacterium]|nr:hypothetical protein BMS3Abin09_00151 [bacterium BMS3Abin09]GBE41820.1 hypothetical protein BMS3Bbin09_01728 [bacterium BMS3Bbin09]HDO66666.1 hypothetical protein [Nitrospirota bacterium]HDZ84633.1 hypothetical protein [Nitrospirota bacterium]HEW80840.1 hypothetical protein [Nitrospirota bacterium]